MRALIAVTLIAGLGGAACIAVATQSPSYVDANGFLVEPFAWIAAGRLLILASALSAAAAVCGYRLLK